eukprot:SAG31_NODE_19084_length_612_cov_1.274854_1_plen_84_part_10
MGRVWQLLRPQDTRAKLVLWQPAQPRAQTQMRKGGDDDDLLRMMGVRPKCSNMQEVVEHYTDEPYPPRNPEDERRRIVMDPNNT